jgi:hypothetical protein
MHQANNHRENITTNGFTILNDIYTADEIDAIIATINKADQSNPTFRKTDDFLQ